MERIKMWYIFKNFFLFIYFLLFTIKNKKKWKMQAKAHSVLAVEEIVTVVLGLYAKVLLKSALLRLKFH